MLLDCIYQEIMETIPKDIIKIQTNTPITTISAYPFLNHVHEYDSESILSGTTDNTSYYTTIRGHDNQLYYGKTVLCTIPLTCLPSVQFIPPLPPSLMKTSENANISKYYKAYVNVSNIPTENQHNHVISYPNSIIESTIIRNNSNKTDDFASFPSTPGTPASSTSNINHSVRTNIVLP